MAVGVNINPDSTDSTGIPIKKPAKVHPARKLLWDKAVKVDRVCEILGQRGRIHKTKLIKLVVNEFGCSWRTARIYIAEAKKIIVEASGKTRDEHISEYLNNLNTLITNAKDQKTLLQALSMKSKLLGLDAPKTVHLKTETTPLLNPELQQKMLSDPKVLEAAAGLEEAIGNG